MSETPSENGHLETVDEPSMEDILASIRKIIADDDQVGETADLEISDSPSGLNSKGYASDALVTGSFGHAPGEPEASPAPSVYDENSVFNDLRGSQGLDDILKNDFDSDEDLVDLDIDALLSQADAPLETFDDALDETATEEEALSDILALDIPDPEPDLSINPSANHDPEPVLSAGGSQAFESGISQDDSLESLIQPEIDSEANIAADSLFDELEELLTDEPADVDNLGLSGIDLSSSDNIPEPILERTECKGLLGAGLAAVGFGAKAKLDAASKSNEPVEADMTENAIADDLMSDVLDSDVTSENTDDDLDAMLESLINDLDVQDAEEPSEAELPAEDLIDANPISSLQTDEDEMVLVKSLIADLADPESNVPENETPQDDLDLVGDVLGDLDLGEFTEDETSPVETVDENLSVLQEDIFESDESELSAGEPLNVMEEDKLDLDIEALLNGDLDESEIDNIITGSSELSDDADTGLEAEADMNSDDILDSILDMGLEDELNSHEDELESLLEIPELEEPEPELEASEAESSELSIEDELVPDLESILEDEADNIALNEADAEADLEVSEDLSQDTQSEEVAEETSSLLEIAMEAEKEAEMLEAQPETAAEQSAEAELETLLEADELEDDASSETAPMTVGAIAAASGLGLATAAATAASSGLLEQVESPVSQKEPEGAPLETVSDAPVLSTPDTTPEPEQIIQKETAPMPSAAAKSDTILDEVTSSSTAEAFASLNQVVEEKAIVAERGDRVGDLVMDALRPMLKEWLDENLKGIVERAVTKEVKRISSGK